MILVQMESISEWLFGEAPAGELGSIVSVLEGHRDSLSQKAWALLKDLTVENGCHLRAAAVAAATNPTDPRWVILRDKTGRLVG